MILRDFATPANVSRIKARPGVLQSHFAIQGTQMTDTVHDIVDTAVAAGTFTTLVAAVSAAGLVDTLKGAGPFTVFAPSDEAFARLPKGTVEDLVKPENKDKLTAILLLHVIPGKVMAADVAGKVLDPATAGGATVHVDGTDGVSVNGAKVVTADIGCSNGVIHVIDAVLLPKA
ncbi:beta-Ig-H3/fasciclin [Polymorphobacter glacialis]|uniref:Beta-Ig-H3/fasciclin n=2 Tax=Sandarakinorhabdus glacialis TaxID=1614636 RepID=A0A917EDE0_9SPHN|nr:beta-Ig-H3/fasciclin [Polymorphobacter glacialis]